MRVTLTTIGKNHSFDLARQLHQRNALTAIFTGYPRFKLRDEGLPSSLIRTFPWLRTLYMAMYRYGLGGRVLDRELFWWSHLLLDQYVSKRVPQSDIFMALSNTGLRTGKVMQTRGGLYICDRGCSHIRYQDQLLREEFALRRLPFEGIDPRVIAREEAEYAIADVITVPSLFSKHSFIEMGIPENKLAVIPYGVSTARFHPAGHPETGNFDVIYVGALSLRKGIPYLLEAFACIKHPRKRLHLVGSRSSETQSLIDQYALTMPITQHGHCPQPELKSILSRSHVMILPSVEDGFGLVMAEAMACGCPVIASAHTGAQDLYQDGIEGYIVPARNSAALAERMQEVADNPHLRDTMSKAGLKRVESFGGWNTYGDEIYTLFSRMVEQRAW